MKRLGIITIVLGIVLLLATPVAAKNNKVTICHAAGKDGTNKYVTLTISENAVYKEQGGHFFEDGTPRAGHEDDYFGACNNEITTTTTVVSTTTTAGIPTTTVGDTTTTTLSTTTTTEGGVTSTTTTTIKKPIPTTTSVFIVPSTITEVTVVNTTITPTTEQMTSTTTTTVERPTELPQTGLSTTWKQFLLGLGLLSGGMIILTVARKNEYGS